MSNPEIPSHLDPSELGTKSYWDDCYERELQNHNENADDEGTVWFSDSGAEEKVIDYLDELVEEGFLSKGQPDGIEYDSQGSSFLDLGTGNGHLLFALRDAGWAGYMLGVDYSHASIQLAKQIGVARAAEDEANTNTEVDDSASKLPVHFQQHDILSTSPAAPSHPHFSILLDKGTFDAISLSSATDAAGRRPNEHYRARILPFLRPGGLLIITSCNWTEAELRSWFERDDGLLGFKDRIKYPSYRFGGVEGQTVVTLCFERKGEEP